jgi:hypothetical protein
LPDTITLFLERPTLIAEVFNPPCNANLSIGLGQRAIRTNIATRNATMDDIIGIVVGRLGTLRLYIRDDLAHAWGCHLFRLVRQGQPLAKRKDAIVGCRTPKRFLVWPYSGDPNRDM